MRKIPTRPFLAAVLMGGVNIAGAAQWTGYVFNGETRAPMAGVLVTSNAGVQATTDALGAYRIEDPTSGIERRSSASWDPAGQTLFVQLEQREVLRLEVLDLSGRLLSRPYSGEAGPGVWQWSSSSMDRSLSPVVLRLVRGGQSKSWTMLPGIGGLPRYARGIQAARTAATTISDTFVISNPGYDSARVLAQAGSSALDTAWLSPRVELAGIPWNAAITYGTLKDARDNRTYRTVRIGSQNWMAQNLNYKPAVADSGLCYFNNADSCNKYGRLYGWYTAMAGQLASPYLPRPATGICPNGWHLPSQTEWGELTKFVGPAPKGARDLKSTVGWTKFGNGSDAYGFRALPAGVNMGRGAFAYGGQMAFWWTSTAAAQDSNSISMILEPSSYTLASSSQLYLGYSVRCLEGALGKPKDSILTSLVVYGGRGRSLAPAFHPDTLVYRDTVPWTIASVIVAAKTLDTTTASVWTNGVKTNNVNVPLGANGTTTLIKVVVRSQDGDSLKYQVSVYRPVAPPTFGIPWKTGPTYGTLYDTRDGNVYRTVMTDGIQTWMAQNLNYKVAGADSGSCVSNSIDSCAKYGRLYQWATVMNGADSSRSFPSGVKGICPVGWHIPSEQEWIYLMHLGRDGYTTSEELKSLAGWADATNGTDARGFRALPAGELNVNSWQYQGTEASWWSTTMLSAADGFYPNLQVIKSTSVIPFSGATWATQGHSLRCLKN